MSRKLLARLLAFRSTWQAYGYPRVYRRFLEANQRFVTDRVVRTRYAERVKYVMRLPNRLVAMWQR